MGGACCRNWEGGEMHTRFEVKNIKERDYMEDLGVDWRIKLKCT